MEVTPTKGNWYVEWNGAYGAAFIKTDVDGATIAKVNAVDHPADEPGDHSKQEAVKTAEWMALAPAAIELLQNIAKGADHTLNWAPTDPPEKKLELILSEVVKFLNKHGIEHDVPEGNEVPA